MRLVLDTNVLIAAFIARGTCNELLEHCVAHHEIVTSLPLLAEFEEVLLRKFSFPRSETAQALRLLKSRAELVVPTSLPSEVCRDPKDDVVLGTAVGGSCQAIISGDKDLTSLVLYEDIRIVSPSEFWRFERVGNL
jgi:uncharacterized protein